MSKQIQHNLNIMMSEVMDILNARTSEVISAYAKKFGAAPDSLEYELWTWRVNNANATPDTFEFETEEIAEVAYDAETEAAIERVASEAPKFYVQTLTNVVMVEADSADMAVMVAAQTLEKVGSRLEVSKAPTLSYGETVAYRAGHRSLRSAERTVYWVQRV